MEVYIRTGNKLNENYALR